MAKETIDSIKAWVPIVILAGGLIAGWVRMDARIDVNSKAIEKTNNTCAETEQKTHSHDVSMVRIETNMQAVTTNLARLTERVDQAVKEQRASTSAILERLP